MMQRSASVGTATRGEPAQRVAIVRRLGQHPAGIEKECLVAAGLLELGDQALAFAGPLQGDEELTDRRAHRLHQLDELGIGRARCSVLSISTTPTTWSAKRTGKTTALRRPSERGRAGRESRVGG